MSSGSSTDAPEEKIGVINESAKHEFFLEVRCEEIPARMLVPGARALATRLFEELMSRNLAPDEVRTGFTPRRLIVTLDGLPECEPDAEEQVVGPPMSVARKEDGSWAPAALGFAKRCGVDPDDMEEIDTPKGRYVAVTQKTIGRPTPAVLAELVPSVLVGLSWQKTMRWGSGVGPWVRPIHGIVAIYAGEVVDFELFGQRSGNTTTGHAILSPETFEVSDSKSYEKALSELGIQPILDDRKEILLAAMNERAEEQGGAVVADGELLDKLAAICEIPGVALGEFSESFLELPREVLVASLKDHQSAFTVEKDGELLPCFLTVMDRPDDPHGRVRAGNEWVVEARLADARFFFDEDRKQSLEELAPRLQSLGFHRELGSYADKTGRIGALAEILCEELGAPELAADAKRAASLSKIDLTTEMVREFTSLQGIMGGVYAAADGEPEAVCHAIYDQYKPSSTDDPIPRDRVGQIVALADRLDTLLGMFGLGLVPTGSRDPFGLRRAAQAVVRILLEGGLSLDVDLVAAKSIRLYGDQLKFSGEEVLAKLRPFLDDRSRHILALEGFAYDEIEAALVVRSSDVPDLKARVAALHEARSEPGFLALVLAAKRIANIVRDEAEVTLREDLLTEEAEKELYTASLKLRAEVDTAEAAGEYETCLRRIAGFSDVLDRFFVEVLVMDENLDLRNNRIALLQSVQRIVSRTARLTEMVVDKSSGEKQAKSENKAKE